MAMTEPVHIVDAFADAPFTGNPAAVVVLRQQAEAAWMQDVAMEMNLSETAFVRPIDHDAAPFELRWFTPAVEVELCGHATLATAHVLWTVGWQEIGTALRFLTRKAGVTTRAVGKAFC